MNELPAEIEAFVMAQPVARLATVDRQGLPHVVPVCFVWSGGRLYTPVDEVKPKAVGVEQLQRVRNIRSQRHVQVLLDHYDDDWARLAFVQIRGSAYLLSEGPEYEDAAVLLKDKYRQYAKSGLERRPIIKVVPERLVTWGAVGP